MYPKYFHTYPVLVRDIGFSSLSDMLPTDSVSSIQAAGSLFAADSSYVNMPTVVGVTSVQDSKILNPFVFPN